MLPLQVLADARVHCQTIFTSVCDLKLGYLTIQQISTMIYLQTKYFCSYQRVASLLQYFKHKKDWCCFRDSANIKLLIWAITNNSMRLLRLLFAKKFYTWEELRSHDVSIGQHLQFYTHDKITRFFFQTRVHN